MTARAEQQRAIDRLKHRLATAQGMYEAERYRRERVEAKLDRARTELNALADAALNADLAAEATDIDTTLNTPTPTKHRARRSEDTDR